MLLTNIQIVIFILVTACGVNTTNRLLVPDPLGLSPGLWTELRVNASIAMFTLGLIAH